MDQAEPAKTTPEWPFVHGEMAQRVREHDWAATPLGAVRNWPAILRTTAQLVLAHPFATIVLWGPELVQIYNDAYRDLMGVKHPAGLGQPTRACWPEVWHINAPIYERVWQGESLCFEDALYPITRSGVLEDAWFSLSYSPVRDEAGRVAGVFLTIIETTRRLRAEAALRESEARFRGLVEGFAQAVWETDAQGEVVTDSPSWRAYTGQALERWLGNGWVQALHPEDRLQAERQWREAVATIRSVNAEYRLRCAAGDYRWTNVRAIPLFGADGAVCKWVGVNIDIDARKQAEEALRRSEARQAFLLGLSDALRPLQDVQAIKLEATRLLGEHLGANRVLYADVQGDDWIVAKGYEQGVVPLPDGRYAARTYGSWIMQTYRAGRRFVVHDANGDPRFSPSERLAHVAVQALGTAGVPLVKGTTLVAVLVAHTCVPRCWTEEELVLVEDTAERTWAAVERARAEGALRESEQRLRLALSVGELATWDWDLRTDRVVWSDEHYRMQGYAVGEVEPSYEAWLARVHPEDRAPTQAAVVRARAQRISFAREFRSIHADGSVHWLAAQGHFFYDGQGTAVRMIGVMRDATEQRNTRALLEQHVAERTQALRQLLLHLETLQDEERRRIARELHDGLGQYLSSVALAVSALRHSRDHSAAQERLQRLHELMQQLDRELDRIVFILRPTALEDCGLGEGVATYVQTWSALTGVGAEVELHGLDGARLGAPVEAAAFRVVQEALNNVAKYAQASHVSVSLERCRGHLVGSVDDDGVGFDAADATTPAAGRTRWGLLGMQERIEALGGSFAIDSQPGGGTTVLWRLPLVRAS